MGRETTEKKEKWNNCPNLSRKSLSVSEAIRFDLLRITPSYLIWSHFTASPLFALCCIATVDYTPQHKEMIPGWFKRKSQFQRRLSFDGRGEVNTGRPGQVRYFGGTMRTYWTTNINTHIFFLGGFSTSWTTQIPIRVLHSLRRKPTGRARAAKFIERKINLIVKVKL